VRKAFGEIKDRYINMPPTESQLMQKASILPLSIAKIGQKLGEGEVGIMKIHYIKKIVAIDFK
jgi:hypothetical protein